MDQKDVLLTAGVSVVMFSIPQLFIIGAILLGVILIAKFAGRFLDKVEIPTFRKPKKGQIEAVMLDRVDN